MKKRLIILFLMAAVLLAACTNGNNYVFDIEIDGELFTVDTKKDTITHAGDVYGYESGQWPDGMQITYPNGADFRNGKGSSNYDPERYVDGETLISVASQAENNKPAVKNPVEVLGKIGLGILVSGFGILYMLYPQDIWFLKNGWKFREAEPSDLYLGLVRFGGGVSVLIGIITILVAIFGT